MIWHITWSPIFYSTHFRNHLWSLTAKVLLKGFQLQQTFLHKKRFLAVQPCTEWNSIKKFYPKNFFIHYLKFILTSADLWDQNHPFYGNSPKKWQSPTPTDNKSHIPSLSLLGWESCKFSNRWIFASVYPVVFVTCKIAFYISGKYKSSNRLTKIPKTD